jgi:hypothetical protein
VKYTKVQKGEVRYENLLIVTEVLEVQEMYPVLSFAGGEDIYGNMARYNRLMLSVEFVIVS